MPNSVSKWPYPALIAHRGAGLKAPENTLTAFRTGAACGFSMMEYDVKLSADDVPILLHDDSLDRTSNGTGRACDLLYAEMARFDFGGWHSPACAGEPVPTLYHIAAWTLANGVHSNIEIKPCTGLETHTGERIAALAQKLWADAPLPPLLSSFSESALAAAQEAAPGLPRALLIEKDLPPDWQQRVARLGCKGLNLNYRYVTREIVQEIHAAGLFVAVWTVNDTNRARELLDWGCKALITDAVDTLAPGRFQ